MGIWNRNRKMWVVALALLLANLVALAAYRWVYAGRAADRVAGYDRSSATLRELEARRQAAEEYAGRVQTTERQVSSFLNERLGRQEERVTEIIAEIKTLAKTAGLEPSQISYRSEEVDEQGLVERSLSFSVSGSYLDLRKLVNLLELSDSFITLQQVSLSESDIGGSELRITLQLSSLFVAGEMKMAAARPAGAGADG